MKEKAENIKIRILAPVFLALLTVAVIAISNIHHSQSNLIQVNAKTKVARTQDLLQLLLDKNTELLSSLNSSVRRDKKLQRDWLNKDKQALLQKALPVFNEIKTKHGVSHFYFMTTDSKCFLRVHQPDRYGDFINRLTMQKAIRTGAMGAGVELGPLGTLTLRVVFPWHINGKLAGYIELGQEIDHAITDLHKLLGLELVLMVKKNLLDRARWQHTMQKMGRDSDWHQFKGLVIIDSTMKKAPELERGAYNNHMASHQQNTYEPNLHITSVNGQAFIAGFIPLIDAGENDVGEIFILSDITAEQSALGSFTFILVVTTTLVMLVVFVLFYRYIGHIEQRLIRSRQQILKESQAREAALLKAKKVAEETNQLKNQFLANISHELRTPMNGVMGMLQVLDDTQLSDEQNQYIRIALDSSHTLLKLINDLLDFSKMESGKLTFEQRIIDLHKTVNETVDSLTGEAHKKGLEISCRIDPDVPVQITADPYRLVQVLNNLIVNAIKFTRQGMINVHLGLATPEHGKNTLFFEIIDTGIGIPQNLQETIFNSFSQADGSATRNFGGAGLGLAISKKIIEQAGGQIGVKSTPGEGSCFYFTLPFIPANEAE